MLLFTHTDSDSGFFRDDYQQLFRETLDDKHHFTTWHTQRYKASNGIIRCTRRHVVILTCITDGWPLLGQCTYVDGIGKTIVVCSA